MLYLDFAAANPLENYTSFTLKSGKVAHMFYAIKMWEIGGIAPLILHLGPRYVVLVIVLHPKKRNAETIEDKTGQITESAWTIWTK
jgi:hypothetical protein